MTVGIQDIAFETWRVTIAMAPYVVIGLGAAIVVLALFPRDRIERMLGRRGWASNVKAALVGIPLPLCSCGVLPTALSLRRRGASPGATAAFLVSTPETGLDSIAVTYSLINPLMAVLRPVAAFISALFTGLIVDRFAPDHKSPNGNEHNSCLVCADDDCTTAHGMLERLRASAHYIYFDFLPDIAVWLVAGLILSGVMTAVLPNDLFVSISGWSQMVLVAVAGVPIYICASASTPIAAVLLAKGMSPGAVLVFLLVGPATNLASLTVLSQQLGRRTTALYIGGILVSSLVIGALVNVVLGGWDWSPRIAAPTSHDHTGWYDWLGTTIFLAALLHLWIRRVVAKWRLHRPLVSTSEI